MWHHRSSPKAGSRRWSWFHVCCLAGVLALWAKPMTHFIQRQQCQWTAERDWNQRPERLASVRPGDPIAWLTCSEARLDTLILFGDRPEYLLNFPCWSRPDPVTADAGPIVISGHRDSHFRHLNDLELGDRVLLHVVGSPCPTTFVVEHKEILDPEGVDEVISQAREHLHNRLVLMTCYPFHYVGPAPQRYLVWLQAIPNDPLPTGNTDFASRSEDAMSHAGS